MDGCSRGSEVLVQLCAAPHGGKLDAQARFDLAKWGLWHGLSVTVQGNVNYGETVNGIAGSLIPVNAALFFPGIEDADASDIMALYVQQNFGALAAVLVGKLNLVEFARATPLRGGGADTFWNVNLATPITGNSPPTIFGAQVRINTQPVSYSLTVFDAQDATNQPLFSDLFKEGVNVMGTATFKTTVAGRPGYYGIKGIYSTREVADLSEIIPPPGISGVFTKQGSWFVGLSMQQYLVQDPSNPARGWGVFAELIEIFKDLHAHPELGFMETRTAGVVERELKAHGFKVRSGIAKTGVVGVLENGPGPIVMFRAGGPSRRNTRRSSPGARSACARTSRVPSLSATSPRSAGSTRPW